MQEIEILQEPTDSKPFAVIYKPALLPSAPLSEDDFENAFCQTVRHFPELMKVNGRKAIEHGLMHRLDTETSGLLLIAATQDFYDFMQREQAEGRFIKTYRAEIQKIADNAEKKGGFPPKIEGCAKGLLNGKEIAVQSYFRNFGLGLKEVRPVTENAGKAALKKIGSKKLYSTNIVMVGENLAECKIAAGYRHQVRCHLAWSGIPVKGDRLYNSQWKQEERLEFYATGIQFMNPVTGKMENYLMQP